MILSYHSRIIFWPRFQKISFESKWSRPSRTSRDRFGPGGMFFIPTVVHLFQIFSPTLVQTYLIFRKNVAPYFRNQLFREMWHFGSLRVCSRAFMSLTLSDTPRSNEFHAHSQWGLGQMAVGLLSKQRLEVTSWPLVQKLWKLYQ